MQKPGLSEVSEVRHTLAAELCAKRRIARSLLAEGKAGAARLTFYQIKAIQDVVASCGWGPSMMRPFAHCLNPGNPGHFEAFYDRVGRTRYWRVESRTGPHGPHVISGEGG